MGRSYLLRPRWDTFLRKGGEARVAKLRLSVERAAALHRRAAAVADAAQRALDGDAADAVPQQHFAQQHELAETLRAAAAALAPGWLGATGAVFGPFQALTEVGLLSAPVADRAGLQAVLADAEEWVREPSPRYTLLIVIAALPQLTDGPELARIAALAQAGPAARLHLIVAGWPPPPLTAETTQPPLPLTTHIAVRNPYAVIGDPPGGAFGGAGALNAPVYLGPDPPLETIAPVSGQIAGRGGTHGSAAGDPLPRAPLPGRSA